MAALKVLYDRQARPPGKTRVVAALTLSLLLTSDSRQVRPANPVPANAAPQEVDNYNPKAWRDSHDLCLYACPAGAASSNRVIDRPIYVLSNNGHTKFADWVAYAVSAQTIGRTQPRRWHIDHDLPADETLGPSDYKGIDKVLHMDRGHQAPLASLTGTAAWQDANDLSNITPQAEDLNEGPWEHLEEAERDLARTGIVVHTLTGPLYEHAMPSLPYAKKDHIIPSGYWKIVAIQNGDITQVVAFIMGQETPRHADYCTYKVTVRVVEMRTHLNVFPAMPHASQERLETRPGALLPKLGCP